MDNNKKHFTLRIVMALFIGMAFSCLLDVVDNNFHTQLYENYYTIVYVLIPVILGVCVGTNLWSNMKKKASL